MMDSCLTGKPERVGPVEVEDVRRDLFADFSAIPTGSQKISELEKEHLQVYLRIRPFSSSENDSGESQDCVTIEGPDSVMLKAPRWSLSARLSEKPLTHTAQRFNFTQVYGPETSQRQMFQGTVRRLVRDVLEGRNSLVFTYGVTNAGKTFTFLGPEGDCGVLPRSLAVIFNSIEGRVYSSNNLKPQRCRDFARLTRDQQEEENTSKRNLLRLLKESDCRRNGSSLSSSCKSTFLEGSSLSDCSNVTGGGGGGGEEDSFSLEVDSNTKFSVWVSFCEIYNENLHDLLEHVPNGTHRRTVLRLSQDVKGNSFVKDLRWVQVNTSEEAYRVMKIGKKNQSFSATKLNHLSSRSHSIFSIRILKIEDVGVPRVHTISELSLCDLAGSERCAKTQNRGERLKEAGNINTSLLTLGKCMNALRLNQQAKFQQHVPFRESKLTHYLQGYFCGRGKACMIVNINQCASMYDETLNVLKFSALAQKVVVVTVKPVLTVAPQRSARQVSMMINDAENKDDKAWGRGRKSSMVAWETTLEDVLENEDEEEDEEEEEGSMMEESGAEETVLEAEEEEEDEGDITAMEESSKEQQGAERLILEARIREEVTSEFMELFNQMEKDYNERLANEREILEERADKRLEILKNLVNRSVTDCTRASTAKDTSKEDKAVLLEGVVMAMHEDLLRIRRDAEAAESCLTQLPEPPAGLEELRAQADRLSEELLHAQQETQRQTHELEAMRLEKQESHDQLEAMRLEKQESHDQLEAMRLEKQESHDQLEAMRLEKQESHDQLEAMRLEKQQSHDQLEALRLEKRESHDQLEAMRLEKQESHDQLEAMRLEKQGSHDQLEAMRLACQQLRNQLEASRVVTEDEKKELLLRLESEKLKSAGLVTVCEEKDQMITKLHATMETTFETATRDKALVDSIKQEILEMQQNCQCVRKRKRSEEGPASDGEEEEGRGRPAGPADQPDAKRVALEEERREEVKRMEGVMKKNEEEAEELRKTVDSLTMELDSQVEDYDSLLASLETERQEKVRLTKENKALVNGIFQLQTTSQGQVSEVTALKTRLQQQTDRADRLSEELQSQSERSTQTLQGRDQEVESLRQEARVSVTTTESDGARFRATIEALRKEGAEAVRRSAQRAQQADDLQREVTEVKGQLSQSEEVCTQLRQELDSLRSEASIHLQTCQVEKGLLAQQIEGLEAQLGASRASSARGTELQSQLSESEAQCAALRQRLEEVEAETVRSEEERKKEREERKKDERVIADLRLALSEQEETQTQQEDLIESRTAEVRSLSEELAILKNSRLCNNPEDAVEAKSQKKQEEASVVEALKKEMQKFQERKDRSREEERRKGEEEALSKEALRVKQMNDEQEQLHSPPLEVLERSQSGFPRPEVEIEFSPLKPHTLNLRRQGDSVSLKMKITRSSRKRKSCSLEKGAVESENSKNRRLRGNVRAELQSPSFSVLRSSQKQPLSPVSLKGRKDGTLQKIGDFIQSSPTLLGSKAKTIMGMVSGLSADKQRVATATRPKRTRRKLYKTDISSPMDIPSQPILGAEEEERESDHLIIRRQLRSRKTKL